MYAPQQLPFALGTAPAGFKGAAPAALSAPSSSTLLPAGAAYAGHLRRTLNQLSFADDDAAELARLDAEAALGDDEEIVDDIGDEQESAQLLKSDPKEWKVSSGQRRTGGGEGTGQRAECMQGRATCKAGDRSAAQRRVRWRHAWSKRRRTAESAVRQSPRPRARLRRGLCGSETLECRSNVFQSARFALWQHRA